MDSKKQQQQDIYEAVLHTAERTSDELKSVADNVKKALEVLLAPHYQKNAELQRLASANIVDPKIVIQLGDTDVKPFVESLQRIHIELAESNKEIAIMQNRLTLLQGKTPDPQVKAAYDNQLNQLNQLNEQYKHAYKDLQTHAMVLGDPKLAEKVLDPTYKKVMEDTLKKLHQQVKELKEQIIEKNQVVKKVEQTVAPTVEQTTSPRPGQR
jgi:hypothetical protein